MDDIPGAAPIEAFPAHAGMNRSRVVRFGLSLSVPRACGDEPPGEKPADPTVERSPRMRG